MSCSKIIQRLTSQKGELAACEIKNDHVEENGTSFSIDNPTRKELCCFRVDGCLITNGRRCDYLFCYNPPESYLFVELKNTASVAHAYEQICCSISKLQPILKFEHNSVEAHVVTNLTPNGANQILRRFQERFIQERIGKNIKFHSRGSKKLTI